jgi:fructosamine-3-kinase
MFEAEAAGLNEIARTKAIGVPAVICWGTTINYSYLVLANLELGSKGSDWDLGVKLAAMHQWRSFKEQRFGWSQDNRIGSTPQINSWKSHWVDFFRDNRLAYQFQLAGWSRFSGGQELLDRLPQILNHQPPPALVHGDLWSGNRGFTKAGQPVIFDPAVYWGDREVDIAMTELFGGFSADFYRGYESVYPLPAGYPRRRVVYNLYHLLNHYNLFGGSYQAQAQGAISQALAAF